MDMDMDMGRDRGPSSLTRSRRGFVALPGLHFAGRASCGSLRGIPAALCLGRTLACLAPFQQRGTSAPLASPMKTWTRVSIALCS